MRTLLFAASVAVVLCASPSIAQPTREAAVRRLTVEVKETDHYQTVGGIYGVASVYTGTTRDWRLLADGQRVTEAEFYRIAGDDETAERVARIDRRGKRMYWTGMAMTIGGLVAFLSSSQDWKGELFMDEQGNVSSQAVTGIGIAFVGSLIGLKGKSIVDRKETGVQQAIQSANRFNRRRY